MTTPQVGSQSAVVDVDDRLRQKVRDNEQEQRVDGRLKTVPHWLAEMHRVVVAVDSSADVKVNSCRYSEDDGHRPDDGKRNDRGAYTQRASAWHRNLLSSCRKHAAHALDGNEDHGVDAD